MKLLHRMILRMLPGPFLGALGTLMFLLLMQFLVEHLKNLVGKGLPFGVIVELITYNLVYMLVLAVPMSILLATIATFGRLAESGAYIVVKGAGISLIRLMWPAALVGLVLVGVMSYFNNVTLPEANYKAKALWGDIRQKRPGFALTAGVFYDGLQNYSLRALEMAPATNELRGVTLYDYSEGSRYHILMNAERGQLETTPDGTRLNLMLFDGELHRYHQMVPATGGGERYERMAFARHRVQFDISDLTFERRDPSSTSRSDRTMRTTQMVRVVDSLEADIERRKTEMRVSLGEFGTPPSISRTRPEAEDLPFPSPPVLPAGNVHVGIASLDSLELNEVYDLALQRARSLRADVENASHTLRWSEQRSGRYQVEIHKKWSIAVACLIFVLIGAPLGLRIRRGSLAIVVASSAAIFVFYWVTLVLGEKLADPGYIEPWIGMWAANIVIGCMALVLIVRAVRGRRLRRTTR